MKKVKLYLKYQKDMHCKYLVIKTVNTNEWHPGERLDSDEVQMILDRFGKLSVEVEIS